MVYGGVAQRYCMWQMEGEPFKEKNYWYVRMIHPVTKYPTKVRWYTDKAHADLMPATLKAKKEFFVGGIFGFKDKEDYILCIRERDLTREEVAIEFEYNWTRGGKWRFCTLFGGVWYAPKDAEIPSIMQQHKVFRATWKEWVEAGRAEEIRMYGASKGFWFELEV